MPSRTATRSRGALQRRQGFQTPFPPPPVTWRDTTPGVQASWRRNYGNTVTVGGRIAAILDAIPRNVKTVPHAQYTARKLDSARAPDANPLSIGWTNARSTQLACNDTHYLGLQSGASSYSWNHCLKFNVYATGRTLQILGSEDPLPPDYLQLLDFIATNMLVTRTTPTSSVSVYGGIPPTGATCVIGWSYDRPATTGKIYLNGVLSGTSALMAGDQALMEKESWGSVFPAARGIDAEQYERLFCVGALTDPQMATISANMLAEYPP